MAAFLPIFFSNLTGSHVDNFVTNGSPMLPGLKWILRLQGTNVQSHYFKNDFVSAIAWFFDVLGLDWGNAFNPNNSFEGGHIMTPESGVNDAVRAVTKD